MTSCDLCKVAKENGLRLHCNSAVYDAKIPAGCWANLCEFHFNLYGCKLGTGYGSKLSSNEVTK